MTTLTISETGTIQLPPSILKIFGLTKGAELEVLTSKKGITLQPKTHTMSDSEKQALIEQQINDAFGMVKVTIPKDFNLLDFDVANHVPLFDED